ncbi:MAG: PepSY-associated TM helix domain-containing protein [Candidatus Kapabacteria bacterium]|nr:PepSY-associated TM helix domain-containing protein [Candidatus Kapabacteria bacterium]
MKVATFRKWNNIIHRDLGYLIFGLTIIYAVSGFVLNHVKADGWHPDYIFSSSETKIDKKLIPDEFTENDAKAVLTSIGESNFKNFIFSGDEIIIYFKNGSVSFDKFTGEALVEKKTPLYIIKEFNILHYNNIKKLYTYLADVYAIALFIMAITGLFVIKGKKGITGRGKWLTAIGILIPILILLFYI